MFSFTKYNHLIDDIVNCKKHHTSDSTELSVRMIMVVDIGKLWFQEEILQFLVFTCKVLSGIPEEDPLLKKLLCCCFSSKVKVS